MREVVTLWATRKSIDAGPELLLAWEEYSIDDNLEGWLADCRRALDSLGSDLDQYRYITLRVQESVFERAFFNATVTDVDAELREERS